VQAASAECTNYPAASKPQEGSSKKKKKPKKKRTSGPGRKECISQEKKPDWEEMHRKLEKMLEEMRPEVEEARKKLQEQGLLPKSVEDKSLVCNKCKCTVDSIQPVKKQKRNKSQPDPQKLLMEAIMAPAQVEKKEVSDPEEPSASGKRPEKILESAPVSHPPQGVRGWNGYSVRWVIGIPLAWLLAFAGMNEIVALFLTLLYIF
jgi:hypothetical protein